MAEKSTRKKKLYILIISAIVLTGLIAVYVVTLPYQQYSHAKSLMKSKKYELAISAFADLTDYKDSNELLTENRYLFAKQLLEKKEYLKAKEVFVEIGSYKDSKSIIPEIDYQSGLQYLNNKDYIKAMDSFNHIIEYKDSKELTIEAKYNYGKLLIEEKDYIRAIDTLSEIKGYKDTNEILTETRYKEGILLFEQGDYFLSREYFMSIGKVYKDSKSYLSILPQLAELQGTWEAEDGLQQIVFSGNKVINVYFPDSHKTKVYTWDLALNNNTIMNETGDIYSIKNNKLHVKTTYSVGGSDVSIYSKTSISTNIPEEKPSPRIGMTADEVKASNWGSPSDINKTTSAYGVSEQWVYDDYKYIYLEDGIVTSIQE